MKGVLSTQFQFAGKSPLDLKREASAISRAIHADVVSMRSVNPLQLRRATKLYTKVLSVNEVDVEARQGQARLLLYQDNLSTAAQLIDAGIASQPIPQDPRDDSEWLLIRSELKMRQGDLDGAIADCQSAAQEYPWGSLRSSAQLGMLYASTLQYEKSFHVFQGILDNFTRLLLAIIRLQKKSGVNLSCCRISAYGAQVIVRMPIWFYAVIRSRTLVIMPLSTLSPTLSSENCILIKLI